MLFRSGRFDSEVFPMWNYVTHYGNWTAGFVRMPAAFIDAAHKNGVGVSVTAGIPWASIGTYWQSNLDKMLEVGPQKMADLLNYYGIDSLGYNSEFSSNAAFMARLRTYHSSLYSILQPNNPLYEMVWYDGTNDGGSITFDRGLGTHNELTFGNSTAPVTTSLFFNYNSLQAGLLNSSEIGRAHV